MPLITVLNKCAGICCFLIGLAVCLVAILVRPIPPYARIMLLFVCGIFMMMSVCFYHEVCCQEKKGLPFYFPHDQHVEQT